MYCAVALAGILETGNVMLILFLPPTVTFLQVTNVNDVTPCKFVTYVSPSESSSLLFPLHRDTRISSRMQQSLTSNKS